MTRIYENPGSAKRNNISVIVLVAVVIFWPESVTYWLDKEQKVNVDDVKIEMQIEDTSAPEPAASVASGASAAARRAAPRS